jgi:hypothetical protein
MELGMVDIAYKDLQKTLEMDPQHEIAQSMIQNFNQAPKLAFTGKRFVKV